MKKDITECFVWLDDFCKEYDLFFKINTAGKRKKMTRKPALTLSEVMTIMLLFHQSPAKNFKALTFLEVPSFFR